MGCPIRPSPSRVNSEQVFVGLTVDLARRDFVVGELTPDLRRMPATIDQGGRSCPGAPPLPGRRATAFADGRAVSDDGADTDQAIVSDRAAVQNCVVAHGDSLADRNGESRVGVDRDAVLDVRAPPITIGSNSARTVAEYQMLAFSPR